MDPAVLVDLESLRMDSPDVHSMRFSPDQTIKIDGGESFGSGELDGDILTRSNQQNVVEGELNTLDEPIMDTIKRDLSAVGDKIFHAVYPMRNPKFLLIEWDLWGALFFPTYIGLILQHMNNTYTESSQFTQLIVIVCIGTAIVTYTHVVMLRTNTSIFQYISVLGYCLVPFAMFATAVLLVDLVAGRPIIFRLMLLVPCTAVAFFTSSLILKPGEGVLGEVPYHRVPIGLYYLTIGIFMLYYTGSVSNYVASEPPSAPALVQTTVGTPT